MEALKIKPTLKSLKLSKLIKAFSQTSYFILFLVSLYLGSYAQQATEQNAIHRWEQRFLPSDGLLTRLLADQDYYPRKQDELITLLANLPETSGPQQGTLWESQNKKWLLYFSQTDPNKILTFGLKGEHTLPSQWKLMGYGWTAFLGWLQDQTTKNKQLPKIIPAKHSERWQDPRELHF